MNCAGGKELAKSGGLQGRDLVARIAVNRPLRGLFDYLVQEGTAPRPGSLVRVPFGHTETLGICVELARTSDSRSELKAIRALVGEQPVFTAEMMSLLLWAADYYHHPVGEVLFSALPPTLKRGKRAQPTPAEPCYAIHATDEALARMTRAPRQLQTVQALAEKRHVTRSELREMRVPLAIERALTEKGVLVRAAPPQNAWHPEAAHTPNVEQAAALEAIAKASGFEVFLLLGVTGSGKTEVYLQTIKEVLGRGKQALVLVPEIGLTPQSVARFERRFEKVAVSHSDLPDRMREDAWARSESGQAQVLIGTRSAVFTPFADLGLIVVDEEHDASYKQMSGFSYSARDFAVKRAQALNIPLILGSATPSLESIANAQSGRYKLLRIGKRTAGARLPKLELADIRGERLGKHRAGIGSELLQRMQAHLSGGQQVLLFINRRGFAPVLQCAACGWKAECPACERPMTLHQTPNCLRCHHCGRETRPILSCPECDGSELMPFGAGTQRVAEFVAERFPEVPVVRIDRDAVRGRQIATRLSEIPKGQPAILVGTQMLAKGHHFPDITLVGVLGADFGFISPDFRAPEHTAQIILQVAGRAGRAERSGEVLIQTLHPQHPALNLLAHEGYEVLARRLLQERKSAELPPFGKLALIRADSRKETSAQEWLVELAGIASEKTATEVLGPMPAPAPKRAGRYRFACVLLANHRRALHTTLSHLEKNLPARPPSGVRWMIDVDPLSML